MVVKLIKKYGFLLFPIIFGDLSLLSMSTIIKIVNKELPDLPRTGTDLTEDSEITLTNEPLDKHKTYRSSKFNLSEIFKHTNRALKADIR
jgi:hypothetical protein